MNTDISSRIAGGVSITKGRQKRSEPGRPLVSIITAVRNSEALLESTILSIVEQKYDNIEYIIIGAASTDRSLEIIKKYQDVIEYWINEPDQGIYEAWNKGLLVSKGDWIGFLGAGDIYYEDAIKNYMNRIFESSEKELDYISSKNELISKKDEVLRVIGSKWQWKHFKRYMNVAHVGSLHNKKLFQKYGCFDPNYKICGDYELLLRPRDNLKAEFVNKITTKMRIGGISHNWKQALEEAMRAKMITGKREKNLCYIEKRIAILKFWLRSSVYFAHDKII